MKQLLPGLLSINYISAEALPNDVIARCLSGTPVAIYNPSTKVQFFGEPSCESTESNGGTLESTTLEFLTSDEIPNDKNLGFIVTDVNGTSYLIGQKEGPFPNIDINNTIGKPSGSQNCRTVKVTFKAKKSLIPCVF